MKIDDSISFWLLRLKEEKQFSRIAEIVDKDVMSFVATKTDNYLMNKLANLPVPGGSRAVINKIKEMGDDTVKDFLVLYVNIYHPKLESELALSITLLDSSINIINNQKEYFTNITKYGENLSLKAKNGEYSYLVPRPETRDLLAILEQEELACALLLGTSGAGKTKLVYQFAVENPGLTVIEITGNSFIRNTHYRGTLEQRAHEIFNEAIANKKLVLFIDEIHYVLKNQDLANIIKPVLSEKKLKLIGATTHDELSIFSNNDPSIRRFTILELPKPGKELIQTAVNKLAAKKANYHHVKIDKELTEMVLTLSETLFPDQSLEKVSRLLDLSMASIKVVGITNKLSLDDIIFAAAKLSNKSVAEVFNIL